MKHAFGILALGFMLIAATPISFGGWAVVTFEDVPDYFVVNEPTTLSFKIRQHGVTVLNDRSPSVTTNDANGGLFSKLFGKDSFDATFNKENGVYQATITPAELGAVTLTVNTDVFRWKTKLLPLPVLASRRGEAPLAPVDRGRLLFAAKGCATCHAKSDDPAFVDWQVVHVGPDLTDRTYPGEWLASKIADPARFVVPSSPDKMPNLGVPDAQVTALVAYINGHHVTVTEGKPDADRGAS